MLSVSPGQLDSHKRVAENAGMTHGGTYDTEVTVGVTPAAQPDVLIAHGCSSLMRIRRVVQPGDGRKITTIPNYAVQYPNGLPRIQGPVILRAMMQVHPNDVLSLSNPTAVKVVPVPQRLHDSYPWAHAGGAQEVATAYGCRTVDEMFARHGQAVLV